VSGRIVAHVHGGDRAVGVVDDSLRHAISKLAHVHFAATPGAAERLERLGEDRWRIHYVGSPGVEGIREEGAPANPAGLPAGSYALVVQHPSGGDDATERRRASMVLKAVRSTGFEQIVTIYPNNDPGSAGIIAAIESGRDELRVYRNCTRTDYLALLRDAAVLVGNSSSGIIEAASFGTPVIDIGDRQRGREHGNNVTHVPYVRSRIVEAIRAHAGRRSRGRRPSHNRYSRPNTSKRIAEILALLPLDGRTSGKLIAY
jgi:UDP-hydrolysing UDP-N-acetyl-D-glucosamine 2-epimerase